MKYLLDANVISAIVADPRGPVTDRIAEVGETNVFTSIIVGAEVAFGVRKRGSGELARKVANVMSKIHMASFDPPADAHYADIRLFLQQLGQQIGPNDLWIAAHARVLDAVLVTGNEREFSRVPGLKIENWLRHAPAA